MEGEEENEEASISERRTRYTLFFSTPPKKMMLNSIGVTPLTHFPALCTLRGEINKTVTAR